MGIRVGTDVVNVLGLGVGSGDVVGCASWADMLVASDSTDRSQLDFIMTLDVCDLWVDTVYLDKRVSME